MRRHLVRKSAKGQVVHIGKDRKEPSARQRKQDRQPHEVSREAGLGPLVVGEVLLSPAGFPWKQWTCPVRPGCRAGRTHLGKKMPSEQQARGGGGLAQRPVSKAASQMPPWPAGQQQVSSWCAEPGHSGAQQGRIVVIWLSPGTVQSSFVAVSGQQMPD